jgi:hypothetical protein
MVVLATVFFHNGRHWILKKCFNHALESPNSARPSGQAQWAGRNFVQQFFETAAIIN